MEETEDLRLRLEPTEEWLALEYDLPGEDTGLEERADAERDRYDAQIYAALVAPSF